MRTYINAGFLDYLNQRYHSDQLPRLAVFPFSVPETFAPTGAESLDFGRELANLFHRELVRSGEVKIVELFNRDSWPGKRAEFNTGNYTALQLARAAGYDLLLIGYMEEIKNETDLTVYTRIIDTANATTVWYGKTTAYSNERPWSRAWSAVPFIGTPERPDLFHFSDRSENLAVCTLERILESEPLTADEAAQTAAPQQQPSAPRKTLPR